MKVFDTTPVSGAEDMLTGRVEVDGLSKNGDPGRLYDGDGTSVGTLVIEQ